MADKRISELNALTAPVKDDVVLISDTSTTETKKITFQNLFKLLNVKSVLVNLGKIVIRIF